MRTLDRRSVLKAGIGAGAGLALSASRASAAPRPGERSVRVAHLTDIHVQPELGAAEGLAQCLAHVHALDDRPGFIVTGGDLIMDGFASDEARTRTQWDIFTKTVRDHAGLKVEHCLGNHDIWGWNKGKSGSSGDEKRWGKAWAIETLGLPGRFRSFDRAGWHFVVLDSVQVDPADADGYLGLIDPEQWDWLEKDLGGVPKGVHTLVVSHVPILSATPLTTKNINERNEHRISGGLLHVDGPRLIDLFARTGTVRACLSGHVHLVDRVDYEGVSYYCNGAVCGSWWKGRHVTCDEGYALIDLHEDGRVERTYTTYGWTARKA